MVEVVIPGPERSEGARKPSGYGDCRDMDSGLAPRGAPRNDGGARLFRPGRVHRRAADDRAPPRILRMQRPRGLRVWPD